MRFIYFFVAVLLLPFISNAQSIEAGVFLGISTYSGELAYNNIEPTELGITYGIMGRYSLKDYLSLKAGFYIGQVSGTDANSESQALRERNLSFESQIIEFHITPEYNIHSFTLPSSHVITPYVYLGISGFYFNPQTSFEGTSVDLQPLGTEGQGLPDFDSPYSRYAFAIPLGFGIKLALSNTTTIALEMGMRYTFTDYIDDVSGLYVDPILLEESRGILAAALSNRTPEFTGLPLSIEDRTGQRRGNSDTKDWFYFAGVSISINLMGDPKETKKTKTKK